MGGELTLEAWQQFRDKWPEQPLVFYVNIGPCRACRWWAPRQMPDLRPDELEWGRCLLTDSVDRYRHPASRARGIADQDTSCSLLTAPDFGCNQFTPREEPT